jgi:spore coat polysaccharide biosynthesis protein SpsF
LKSPVVAVVQARLGSSRLPNKMMLWLHGYPVIDWVRQRLKVAKNLDSIIFAIPDSAGDSVLAEHLTRSGAEVYRGPENDVLARFHGAATSANAGAVVRICADNPFVSGAQIDRLVDFYCNIDCDYAYNHIPYNNLYPDGLGAEITSMPILDILLKKAHDPAHREHLFNYLWDNSNDFHIRTFDPDDEAIARPDIRLDLDTLDDYRRLLRMTVRPNMLDRDIVAAAVDVYESDI